MKIDPATNRPVLYSASFKDRDVPTTFEYDSIQAATPLKAAFLENQMLGIADHYGADVERAIFVLKTHRHLESLQTTPVSLTGP